MSRFNGIVLSLSFAFLSTLLANVIWSHYGWYSSIMVILVLGIAILGEHYVSGKGYYHYTATNGVFVGRVPVWIPFFWVFSILLFLLIPIYSGVEGIGIPLSAGLLGLITDFTFIEPYMCRTRGLWQWTSVQKGYFSFVPAELNRFTAPVGNYLTWFAFSLIMGMFLLIMQQMLPIP